MLPTACASLKVAMIYARYALWAALAGAFIPVMAVLSARLGRSIGEPAHAAVILFAVGLVAACCASLLLTGRLPGLSALSAGAPINLAGGIIVAFYVVSMTVVAPRFGVGNAILFAVSAQMFTSAAIDHFGLFGAAVRPVSGLRAAGLAVMVLGLAVSQFASNVAPK